jgi:uncharacterized membrane protein YphA (DoxX/SURF4 family)
VSDRLAQVDVQTMLTVHGLLVASACWLVVARRWRTPVAALAVGFFSYLWFGVNQRWEGRVLFSFSPTRGLTEADMVVPVVVGIALLLRIGRRRLRPQGDQGDERSMI